MVMPVGRWCGEGKLTTENLHRQYAHALCYNHRLCQTIVCICPGDQLVESWSQKIN